MSCSADALDDRDQLLGWVALLACEADEFAGARDDRATLWGATDAHAEPAAELQKTFLAQGAQRTQHRVGVHAHDRREIASGGQALPGLCLAVGDRTTNLPGDLVVQRHGVGMIDAFEHCAIHISIMLINPRGAPACP